MKESDDINKIQLQETSSIDSIEFINTIDLINKNARIPIVKVFNHIIINLANYF